MIRRILAVLAVCVPLALSACGGDDSDDETAATTQDTTTEESTSDNSSSASAGGEGTISISETEYSLDPSDPTAKAGSVTIEAVNDGSIVHDLEIEGNGVEEEVEDLDPGSSGEVTVDLEPGTYEIYCSIGTHRDQGMDGTLTVD